MTRAGQTKPATATVYEVGYGRPPAEHRFRKGRSGNPRGRPRRDPRALPPVGQTVGPSEAFRSVARMPLTMSLEGRRIATTRGEAVGPRSVAGAFPGRLPGR